MSRLRANEVLNQAGTGAVSATEGLTVPTGKSITFTDASEPTLLDGTSLTTTTLNVDQLNIGDDDGTKAKSIKLGDGDDLTLYYDGRLGYVTSYIESDQMIIRPKTTPSDTYIDMLDGGPVRLYYGSSSRLSTASTGVDIIGNLTVSLDVSTANLTSNSSGITTPYLTSVSTGTAVTGTTTSTDGWGGTTSSANILGGLAMPFTCGLNGRIALPPTNATMLFGGSEYNGDNTEGATMPHAGKLVAATLHAENAVGDLQLRATLNGVQDSSYAMSFSSPTPSSPSVVQTFYSSPMTFTAGDRVNFGVFLTSLTQLEVLTVTFFVKFD